MKRKNKVETVYCLIETSIKICDVDATTLVEYLLDGHVNYLSADEADKGRRRGDAYDNPGMTRVVGFKIIPFLPKKANAKKKGQHKCLKK